MSEQTSVDEGLCTACSTEPCEEHASAQPVLSDGPWRLKDARWWTTAILDAKGQPLAKPLGFAHEGDVRLMMASREMYDALKLTALHFRRMQVSGNFQGDDEYEAWSAIDRAIAKAEGK